MNSAFLWMMSVKEVENCRCDSTKGCTQNSAVWLHTHPKPEPISSLGPFHLPARTFWTRQMFSFHRKHHKSTRSLPRRESRPPRSDKSSASHFLVPPDRYRSSAPCWVTLSHCLRPLLLFLSPVGVKRCRGPVAVNRLSADDAVSLCLSQFDVLGLQHLGQGLLHPQGCEARGRAVSPALRHHLSHLSQTLRPHKPILTH